jgi:hypothetical protein
MAVMKKIVFIIIIISTMSSCGFLSRICYRSIDTIKEDVVTYSSLPVEVKEYFDTIGKSSLPERDDFLDNSEHVTSSEKPANHFIPYLFIFNTAYTYELGIVLALKGSDWISHFLVIDKTNNISYRMNIGRPIQPTIVYDREIFTPTDYNMIMDMTSKTKNENKMLHVTFNRHLLNNDGRYRRIWRHNAKDNVKKQKEGANAKNKARN